MASNRKRIKVGIDDGETITVYSVPQSALDEVESGESVDILREKGKHLYTLQVFKDCR